MTHCMVLWCENTGRIPGISYFRWGIVGSGRISHDFVTAVQTLPHSDHQVIAVAARSKSDADKFAEDHSIPRSYEGYLRLAQDLDVDVILRNGLIGRAFQNLGKIVELCLEVNDVVYIANLNSQHFETAKMMLELGKHVLCEKPFTINEKQTRRLFKIAKERKLFLMEAIWSRFFPAYHEMRRIIDAGEIGDVLFASVDFGLALQHLERMQKLDMGGGAILGLGIYILQFQQYVFRGLKPIRVVINGHLNEHGTDESCGAIITYPEGKLAVVSTSGRVKLHNEATVVGTKGILKLPDFWCPTTLITPEGTKEYPLPESSVPFLHHNSAGLSYEAEAVRQCINAGLTECSIMPHEDSTELARLMDLMRKELGVAYAEDLQEF